jgi:hypothetical protein
MHRGYLNITDKAKNCENQKFILKLVISNLECWSKNPLKRKPSINFHSSNKIYHKHVSLTSNNKYLINPMRYWQHSYPFHFGKE